jgi:hypothetical protein
MEECAPSWLASGSGFGRDPICRELNSAEGIQMLNRHVTYGLAQRSWSDVNPCGLSLLEELYLIPWATNPGRVDIYLEVGALEDSWPESNRYDAWTNKSAWTNQSRDLIHRFATHKIIMIRKDPIVLRNQMK